MFPIDQTKQATTATTAPPAEPDPQAATAPPAEPDPNAWQPPVEDATTAPPQSAPTDPAVVAAEASPETTISTSSFDVVADDGSTAKNTPGYSPVPCPVCGNTTLKTANVAAALPTPTLQGDTVNPGDQVVVCDSCSTTVSAGDADRFHADAKAGVYGDEVKAHAEGGTVDEEALAAEAASVAQAELDEAELAEFRAWKAQQTEEGGTGGNG